MPSSTKDILEVYFYKGWNRGDEAALREVLDENIKYKSAFFRRPQKGVNAVVQNVSFTRQALKGYTCEIVDIVIAEDGARAAVRLACRGIHRGVFFGVPGSGHEVHYEPAAFFHLANGKIVEICVVGDMDGLKRQIGVEGSAEISPFPSPTASPSH